MTRLVSMSGKVSRLKEYRARAPARRSRLGEKSAERRLHFLVGDRPAFYRGYPVVGEGDLVTIAGFESGGVLNALAIRNRSTGVDFGGPSPALYLLCGSAILLGGLTLAIDGLGLFFLALAGWLGSRLYRRARALSLVREATPVERPKRRRDRTGVSGEG